MKLIQEEIVQDILNQIGHMYILWFVLQGINHLTLGTDGVHSVLVIFSFTERSLNTEESLV